MCWEAPLTIVIRACGGSRRCARRNAAPAARTTVTAVWASGSPPAGRRFSGSRQFSGAKRRHFLQYTPERAIHVQIKNPPPIAQPTRCVHAEKVEKEEQAGAVTRVQAFLPAA